MSIDPVKPKSDRPKAPLRMSRRGFGLLAAGAVIGGGVFAGRWFNVGATVGDRALSVAQAHEQAATDDILLIDIRRPDEWSRTGIGEGAIPLDMRRDDFVTALTQIAGGDTGRDIALICARGVRSRAMSNRLAKAGFTAILDVPEGMLGSGAGPGWIASGLPVVAYSEG